MRIVIISNIDNTIGLQRDFMLLRDWLTKRGHEVDGQKYDAPASGSGYDLAIFIETMAEHLVPMARRAWYIANPEWLKPEFIRPIQRHCECVIAKTHDAERILRDRFSNVYYSGFLASDKRDTSIPRVPEYLHIGGNSGHRGTAAVISAWREYRYWDKESLPPLTVISNSKSIEAISGVPGITFIKRASDEEITRLQNSCMFHLQPSEYEGFGHAIHESQSVGAILMTTAAGPMSEFHAPFEIPVASTSKACLAILHRVSPVAIRERVPFMASLPNYEIARMQLEARLRFEQSNDAFGDRFNALLDKFSVGHGVQRDAATRNPRGLSETLHRDISTPEPERTALASSGGTRSAAPLSARVPPLVAPLRIAMLGNFGPPFSTENDLLWTLRDMGHTVIPFQENEDTTEEILSGSVGCKLFLYIHTHGWQTPGRMTLDELIQKLDDVGTITASFHLDKYWGLNALDRREDRIGQHPFWRSKFCFTADGGHQSDFAGRGINHFWLPPGVVKRDTFLGARREELHIDVGFVGAEGYHPEYTFRSQLLEFLRAVYGPRFKVFTGYRGSALNDLYASIKVVVGDSCFAGSDFYFSDRAIETPGRGGFLIHPETKGLKIPGLVTFEPQNLIDLQDRIDYYLAHESEREHLRCAAHSWVRENETYTNRMTTLLQKVGLG